MLELTDANFIGTLQKGKFLFMFYTDWCPLCPPIIDMLIDLEQEENGKFTFAKIEYDKSPTAIQLYRAFGVPLVYAVLDGRPLYGVGGLLIPEGYRMIVHELLYDFDEAALESSIMSIIERVDRLKSEQTELLSLS